VTPTQIESLQAQVEAYDRLELPVPPKPMLGRTLRWFLTRLAALAIFILAWQLVVWSGWKPQFLVPSPFTVLDKLGSDLGSYWGDVGTTVGRATIALLAALAGGVVIGGVAAAVPLLRAPLRSIAKGVGTLPSVAWIPVTLIVIGMQTPTILFIGAVGATPPIALGVLAGLTAAPPSLLRSFQEIGAGRVRRVVTVVIPNALPDALAGLRRGWAAAWIGILAAEIFLTLDSLGLGGQLQFNRGLNDYVGVYEVMIVIFVVGVVIDGVLLGGATAFLRWTHGRDD
jgi:NitT/TauT family transport system permease protein